MFICVICLISLFIHASGYETVINILVYLANTLLFSGLNILKVRGPKIRTAPF